MTTITKRATYRKGSLKLEVPIDLPDGTPVQVEITLLESNLPASASLFGAFPELAVLTDDDFAWAKRQWEHGIEKQSRILDGLE